MPSPPDAPNSLTALCEKCGYPGGSRVTHACNPTLYQRGPDSRALYGWRDCPTCNGTGINPVLPLNVCPKCNGEKRVPR